MLEEAIVLAGGLGTRLQNVVSDRPKPMALVNDRPFLEYILEFLEAFNIKNVILSVGYKKEYIKSYFGNSYKSLNLYYSEEDEPLGTGGAIKKALKLAKTKNIIILNGDTYFDINLKSFYDFHVEKQSLLTMALKYMKDFDRYGTVNMGEDGKITGFEEKGAKNIGLINGGIYLINKDLEKDLNNFPDKFSFERDFLEKLVGKKSFYGVPFDGYFIDIGVPEDYEKAKHEFKSR